MLYERGLRGEYIEAFGRGKGTTNESGITFVGDPASIRVKVSCVVAALVESEDGNEAYAGLGNIQDISQFQSVPASNAEIDVTDSNCVDSGPSQAFDRMPFDCPEQFEIGGFRGYMAGSSCVEDEGKI